MDLGISGLASGFDWRTLVDQLSQAERAPQTRLRQDQTKLNQRNTAYDTIKGKLNSLLTQANTLKDTSLFDSRLSTVLDTTVASASASAATPLGTYAFNISKLAKAAAQQGKIDAGAGLSDQDVTTSSPNTGPTLADSNFSAVVAAGTITVNGKQISLETTDTLQGVFNKIKSATGDIEGSYNAASDTITLAGASEIVLGSATDTSNFLTLAKLNNNGLTSVSSASKLGTVNMSGTMASAHFSTVLDATGSFKINGVTISYDASADSVSTVLDRINQSSAGVTATYDSLNDRFLLTNKTTGDVGLAMEDVQGNFLQATQLLNSAGGSLVRGQDLEYTINSGQTIKSHSNIITESSSGLSGLTVTALKESSTSITVTSNTSQVRSAITTFIDKYNEVQNLISTYTASSTDATGKVSAGLLANDSDADSIASRLRSYVAGVISGLSGSINSLDKLGIDTNGYDNNLSVARSTDLDTAINSNLTDLKSFFTDTTRGLATQLSSYLEATAGEDGTLVKQQKSLDSQSSKIDTQVADLERIVQSNREALINSFVAMETARANISQQSSFLSQKFGS